MTFNKNKIVIIVLVLLVLAIIFSAITFFYPSSEFETYRKHGTVLENNNSKDVVIKAFLESIEENTDDYCLKLIEMSDELKGFEICADKKKLNWKNPYEDYSRLIPVEVVLSFERVLCKKPSLQSVNIRLLEDDEFMNFIYDMDELKRRTFDVRIKSDEDIISKGYISNDSENFVGIHILENVIKEISFNNNKVEIYFDSIIERKQVSHRALVEELSFTSRNDQGEFVTTSINKNNAGMIGLGEPCSISFRIEKGINIDEYMREEFLKKGSSTPFNFEAFSIFQDINNEN